MSRQLIRGGLAVLAVALALVVHAHPWMSFTGVVLALVLLGGCPACWISGLLDAWRESRREAAEHPTRKHHHVP